MKPERSATQPNTEDAQTSSSDEAIIKDGTRVGIILTVVPIVIQKNSWGRIPHPLSPGSWRKGYKGFTVAAVNRRWSYFVVDPPSDYRLRGNSGNEYRYQIEADGVIYLLSPEAASPMQNLPPQPSGFPWLPQAS